MKSSLPLVLLVIFISIIIFVGTVMAADIKVTEMAVTTKIAKGNPVDSVRRISSSSVKALFCFTRLIKNGEGDDSIKHVWYKNGQVVGEYELPVKGNRWRTYSSKAIEKGASGNWRVDVLDKEGAVLKSVNFRIN